MPNLNDFRALVESALKYKDLKCYEYINEDNIIGIENPKTHEMAYCFAIGNYNKEIAINVFEDDESLFNVFTALEEKMMEKNIYKNDIEIKQSFMSLMYIDVNDIRDNGLSVYSNYLFEDLSINESEMFKYPIFIDYKEGYVPWMLNSDQCKFFKLIIDILIELSDEIKNGTIMRKDPEEMIIYKSIKNEGKFKWSNVEFEKCYGYLSNPKDKLLNKYNFIEEDELKIRRYLKMPYVKDETWEIGLFYDPKPLKIDDGNDVRGMYNEYFALLDRKTGEEFSYIKLDHWSTNTKLQKNKKKIMNALIKTIEKRKVVPKRILYHGEKLGYILNEFSKTLKISLIKSYDMKMLYENIKIKLN